jgi:hypothetical protein
MNWVRAGAGAVETYMRALVERGALRPCDPHFAAGHLKGLLEAGVMEPMLFGAPMEFPADTGIAEAVDCFLRAYAAG